MTTINEDDYVEYDYEDLCTECSKHDTCHKNGINYDEISKCCDAFNAQVGRKRYKTPEPKEIVQFT